MTVDEMVGQHHRLRGHEFEQPPGVGDGQGSLACCSLWGCKNSDMTELLYCTELNYVQISVGENIFVTFDRIFQLKYPFAQFASFRGILLSHGFHAGSDYKEHTCNVGDLVSVPGLGRSLDKGMDIRSSVLARRISWTVQSMVLQRVGHG